MLARRKLDSVRTLGLLYTAIGLLGVSIVLLLLSWLLGCLLLWLVGYMLAI